MLIETDLKFKSELFHVHQLFISNLINIPATGISRDKKEVAQLSNSLNSSALKTSG